LESVPTAVIANRRLASDQRSRS